MKFQVTMGQTKMTKNYVRFDAMQGKDPSAPVENVYIRREAFDGEKVPELIQLTIEEA